MKNLIILLFLISQVIVGQTFTLKGIVLNENSEPMSSANVYLLNEGKGTATDSNGEFILNAEFDKNDILVVKYLGYKTKEFNINEIDFSKVLEVRLTPQELSSQTVLVEA